MEIAYIVSPNYDYLAASIIEGLHELGHQVFTSEKSNYGQYLSSGNFRKKAAQCDLLLIGSGSYTDYSPLKSIKHEKVIYIDGSDYPSITTNFDYPVNLIFKREYLSTDRTLFSNSVYPLPFAAEKRYFNTGNATKSIPVSFVSAMSNYMRRSAREALIANFGNKAFVGSTGERAYNGIAGYPINTPKYSRILSESHISVSIPGMGWDCARYWEIIAHRSCLVTQRLDIEIPNAFTEGEHYFGFSTIAELINQVNYLMDNTALAKEMADNAFKHLIGFHTSARRAAYLLETIEREYVHGKQVKLDIFGVTRSKFYYAQNFALVKAFKKMQSHPLGKMLKLKGRE